MSAAALVSDIHRQMAALRSARYRYPVRVRMHPLDIETLRRYYVPDADPSAINSVSLLGVPVVADDAVSRGKAEAEYDADWGAA